MIMARVKIVPTKLHIQFYYTSEIILATLIYSDIEASTHVLLDSSPSSEADTSVQVLRD